MKKLAGDALRPIHLGVWALAVVRTLLLAILALPSTLRHIDSSVR